MDIDKKRAIAKIGGTFGVVAGFFSFVFGVWYLSEHTGNTYSPEKQAADWVNDMGIEDTKIVCHKFIERSDIVKCNVASNNDGTIKLYSLDCVPLKSGHLPGCYLSTFTNDKGLL